MEAYRLVEEAQGQAGDLQAMDFRGMTAPSQCHHTAPPQVWNFCFRLESFTVAMDKVVDDAFTNSLVAQDEFVSFRELHQTAKDDRSRKQGIDAFGVSAG